MKWKKRVLAAFLASICLLSACGLPGGELSLIHI